MYRMMEFGEPKEFAKDAKVLAIEYDPNRNARIALIEGENGKRAYIIAPQELQVGGVVKNRVRLSEIPVGTSIYNIELVPGQGGKLVRSAGTSARLLAVEGKYATVELPSKEVRKVLAVCWASVGAISNEHFKFERVGKAGRVRHRGRRPEVRGAAMNPVDHPHGGGEGRAPRGMTHPKTKWGKNAYGVHTRRKHKYSDKWILRRRTK
jgi:large subunit ribosomal protein L2